MHKFFFLMNQFPFHRVPSQMTFISCIFPANIPNPVPKNLFGTIFSLTLFSWLGMMQRTKFGFVLFSVVMRFVSWFLCVCPTVLSIPFLWRDAPKVDSLWTVAPRPTISAEETNEMIREVAQKYWYINGWKIELLSTCFSYHLSIVPSQTHQWNSASGTPSSHWVDPDSSPAIHHKNNPP